MGSPPLLWRVLKLLEGALKQNWEDLVIQGPCSVCVCACTHMQIADSWARKEPGR